MAVRSRMSSASIVRAAQAAGLTLAEVSARYGGLSLSLRRQGEKDERLHPPADTRLQAGDTLTVQAEYEDYRRLRAFTQEIEAPVYAVRPDSLS